MLKKKHEISFILLLNRVFRFLSYFLLLWFLLMYLIYYYFFLLIIYISLLLYLLFSCFVPAVFSFSVCFSFAAFEKRFSVQNVMTNNSRRQTTKQLFDSNAFSKLKKLTQILNKTAANENHHEIKS